MSESVSAEPVRGKVSAAGWLRELRRRFRAAGIESAQSDAGALLCRALGWDRARLHAHAGEWLPEDAACALADMAARRERREPLAYILGVREFWSLGFRVTPDVLIPRPETELLVERAAAHLSGVRAPAVLDLCAGCGAVGVALARELPGARVIMADLSKPALRLCRENAERNGVGGRVRALASDLLAAFSEKAAFDAILSNPPYVCTGEIGGLMPEVARYEPRAALDGGPDGMRFLREIAIGAAPLLRSGGVLLLEMDSGQIPGIARAVRGTGAFLEPTARSDLAGRARALEAVKA